VLEDFKGRSAFDLNALAEKELAKQRRKFQDEHSTDELLQQIRRLIAVPEKLPEAKVMPVKSTEGSGAIERKDCRITRLILETEPGIQVPALRFDSTKGSGEKLGVMLYIHGDGKATEAGADGGIERLVRKGYSVLAVDLRGWGETAPGKVAPNKPGYFGVDEREAFLALHLNRPLLGQRTLDVLALVGWLAREQSNQPIHLTAVGRACPVGLHAATLDRRIASVTLERGVVSWSSVVRTPISRDQLTNVVPGALKWYDLPDLAETLAPRPLTLTNMVDPMGKPLAREEVENAFASCIKAFKKAKAESALRIEISP
jgi:hypothetical protein